MSGPAALAIWIQVTLPVAWRERENEVFLSWETLGQLKPTQFYLYLSKDGKTHGLQTVSIHITLIYEKLRKKQQ